MNLGPSQVEWLEDYAAVIRITREYPGKGPIPEPIFDEYFRNRYETGWVEKRKRIVSAIHYSDRHWKELEQYMVGRQHPTKPDWFVGNRALALALWTHFGDGEIVEPTVEELVEGIRTWN